MLNLRRAARSCFSTVQMDLLEQMLMEDLFLSTSAHMHGICTGKPKATAAAAAEAAAAAAAAAHVDPRLRAMSASLSAMRHPQTAALNHQRSEKVVERTPMAGR